MIYLGLHGNLGKKAVLGCEFRRLLIAKIITVRRKFVAV
jgi:hypothetical protein